MPMDLDDSNGSGGGLWRSAERAVERATGISTARGAVVALVALVVLVATSKRRGR